jgi:hypothetical protein
MRSFLHTVRFVLDTQPDLLRYSTLLPYPTTTLFAEMEREGLLSFERSRLDRRLTGAGGEESLPYGTHHLSPGALRAADFVMKQVFADELARVPSPPERVG